MQKIITLTSQEKQQILDITEPVKRIVQESGVKEGLVTIYVPHATAAITINENYDPNICTDLLDCLNGLVPQGKWLHDQIDNNAAAHIKAAIIGPSETLVIEKGELIFGTWQSLMLCDFDGPKKRKVVVKIMEG